MYTQRILVSNYFYLDELFPKEICDKEGAAALVRLHPLLLPILDAFREKVGKPTWVNNWYHGGDIDEAGWRDPKTSTGAAKSQHKQIWQLKTQGVYRTVSQAADPHVSKMSGKQLFEVIKNNAAFFYKLGVRRIEDPSITPAWLHIDVSEHGQPNTILIIGRTSVIGKIKF